MALYLYISNDARTYARLLTSKLKILFFSAIFGLYLIRHMKVDHYYI